LFFSSSGVTVAEEDTNSREGDDAVDDARDVDVDVVEKGEVERDEVEREGEEDGIGEENPTVVIGIA
tara:strand:- start:58 stop:258 length:201 start_codon:yes stop_codon:yes gene_type:complete